MGRSDLLLEEDRGEIGGKIQQRIREKGKKKRKSNQ